VGQAGGTTAQPPGAGSGGFGIDGCWSMFLSLDLAIAESGTVWAAYARVDEPVVGRTTQVFANAFDQGSATWRTERLLSRAGAAVPLKGVLPTQARAQIAVDGSAAWVAWMHSGDAYEDYTDIDVAWTLDDGASWTGPASVTAKPGGPGAARSAHPQLVALDGLAAFVWDDRRNWTDHLILPLPPDAPIGAPDIYLNVLDPTP
jgi:hypothetical protein